MGIVVDFDLPVVNGVVVNTININLGS